MALLLAVTLTLAPTPQPNPMVEASTAMQQISAYTTSLETAAVDAYLADVAAYLESLRPPPPPPQPAPTSRSSSAPSSTSSSSGGGDCYAGPIPAAIVTRESGGRPDAVNSSSGAYGCFQIMPAVWSANCADLSRDVAGQITCASRISNGGTNLAPWRTG